MKINQRKAGAILSYLGQAIHILSGLLYTPLMLRLLGQSEYGLYQLVSSVVSYLGLLSFGFGSSYVRYYSKCKVAGDEKGLAKLNGMFMVIFCSISVICIICGGVMIGNINLIFGEGLTTSEYSIVRTLLAMMIINLAITFPNSVFNCIITAHEEFFFQKLLVVLHNILNPLLVLPILFMGMGSIGMVIISTFLTIATLVSNMYFCFRKLHVKFIFKGFHYSMLKEMWIFTFFIFLNQIIDQVNWNIDKFLLGRFVGTTAVAIYGVSGQINTLYLQFSTSVSTVFIPKVNKIVAESKDDYELTRLFTKVGRVQFIIMMLILSGFIFFGRPFIKLWAGEEYLQSYYVTIFLIAPVTVPLIQNLGIEIQRAKNMHRTRSIVYLFIAIANVFVSIPLIKEYGPVGAAMGTALSFIVGNIIFMNWYYHKRIGMDMIFFWKNIVHFVPALVLPCVIGIIEMLMVSFNNWKSLIIGIIVYTGTYCVSMCFFGMNEEEKDMIYGPLLKFMKRIHKL